MVSDSIEIESCKTGYASIHYIMNISDKYITKLPTKFDKNGTRIKLKLHDNFLEKLENKAIEKIIETNMTNYLIPIILKQNDKEEKKFDNQGIIIPKHFSTLDGLVVIEFDKEIDELEGYLVLHKKHGLHEYLEENKLAQQNFVITNKKNQIALAPLWMWQSVRYKINIPDVKKLSLKASRNSVNDDTGLMYLREKIAQKAIDYFKSENEKYENDFYKMYAYLHDSGDIFRFQNEFDFLINIQFFHLHSVSMVDEQALEVIFEFSSFNSFYEKLTQDLRIKVAVVKQAYINKSEISSMLISYFYSNGYKFIVIDNFHSRQYFYRFMEPLTIQNMVYVAEVEGLAYQSMLIEKKESLSVGDYSKDYHLNINKNIYGEYFAVVSNNQFNGGNITLINDKHIIGKLIQENKDEHCIKGFKNSVINNFADVCLGKKQKLEIFEWTPEANYFGFEADNLEAYAAKFKRCLTDSFIDSINQVLDEKVLTKLAEEAIIKKEDKALYVLSKDDFPKWYFA